MSAPTLCQLAFNKICLHLWKGSPLLTLHAEFIHKHKQGYPDEEEEEFIEYQRKTDAMLETIEKTVERIGYVPLRLRKEIVNAVNSVDKSVSSFMSLILPHLTHKTLNHLLLCAQHIICTDNLTLDITESICNILLKSKFNVMFKRNFLAAYCVKKSKVKNVYVQVFSTNLSLRKRKKQAYDFIKKLSSGKKYWAKRRHKDIMRQENYNLHNASNLQYVGVLGPYDAFKYFYERVCEEFEDRPGLDEYFLDCAKYLFLQDACCTEKLVFFQEKLNSEMWTELVKDEFQIIFLTYLGDWRYRDRCLPMFHRVKDTIDKKKIQDIFRDILRMLNSNKYDSYGIMTVTRALWDEVPMEWKIDSETVHLVPYLAVLTRNFDVLPYFIKDYTVEVQEDVIANAIFQLMATPDAEHIGALIRTAQASGFKQKEGKQFLTIGRLKNLLIRDAQKFSLVDYDKLAKYLCSNDEEEHKLKQELLQDKYFIIDFLVSVYYRSPLLFFEWALKDEVKINAFKAKLLQDELVDCIYERRLIESDLYDANRIFAAEMLNMNELEITDVRNRVKDNTMVVHWFLLRSMNDPWFPLSQFFEEFSFSKEESEELIRVFLYTPETMQAVYEMVLDLPNFEISMKYSNQGSELMLGWISFITNLVRPYTDVNDYRNRLLPDLDSVVSECYEKVVRCYPKFGRQYAEDIIKLRFTCFALCFERNLEFTLEDNLRFPKTDPVPFMRKLAMAHPPGRLYAF